MKITATVGALCDRLLQDSENHLENGLPCENMGGFLCTFHREDDFSLRQTAGGLGHEELIAQEGIHKNFITGRKQAVSWKLS